MSRITNSRKQNLTREQKEDLARSMNHDITTAERYYNYTSVNDSVVNVLSMEADLAADRNKTSTPSKEKKAGVTAAKSSTSKPMKKKAVETPTLETDSKRGKVSVATSSKRKSTTEADKTFKVLRSKKIKFSENARK